MVAMGMAHADEVRIAVAANFAAPAKLIAADFAQETGHRAVLSIGATGKFHAQITNGAPFDVLLAADDESPARLDRDGRTVAGSRFTYATGRLVLWSAKPGVVDGAGEVLKTGGFKHLALANPRVAPYGQAAIETLTALGLLDALRVNLVQAENIAQAHQFVSTGNAELGFVAVAQVVRQGRIVEGSGWIVPAALHAPIRQDAVLLEAGCGKPAAEAWMRFLRSDKARAVIRSFGYEI
jgi:molybdate transport system substrate-binding protein